MDFSRDIYSSARFQVDIDGLSAVAFASCRGLGGQARYLAVNEGGREVPRLFSDDVIWNPIVLERGVTVDSDLFDWFDRGMPRDGTVSLLGLSGSVVSRWRFERGRVARWKTSDLDAAVQTVSLESIEIVHEGLRWLK